MADYVRVQDGDLDDAATVTTVAGHGNLADYVGYGIEVNVDTSTSPGTYSTSEGKVFCLLEIQYASGAQEDVHDCLVTAHYEPRDGLELAADGVNHIWAVININTNDSPYFEATTSQSPPTDDSVRIAEVDTTADEPVTPVNRDPDGNYEDLSAGNFWVNDTITWPDGVTTDTHPISLGETIENPNDYYDVEASDPPGVVNRAHRANRADSANRADHADYADVAGNSEKLEDHTLNEIFNFAENLRAQPWEPLFDTPFFEDGYKDDYYKDDHDKHDYYRTHDYWDDDDYKKDRYKHDYDKDRYKGSVEIEFDLDDFDYDRYRIRLHVENDDHHSNGLGCYINNCSDNVYNMINLLPDRKYGDRVVQRTGGDSWTVGSTGKNSHSLHEFFIALPDAIGLHGARRRYPLFNSGMQHTAGIGSYELSGVMKKSVKDIYEIDIETSGKELAIRAQIYGQNFFPEP